MTVPIICAVLAALFIRPSAVRLIHRIKHMTDKNPFKPGDVVGVLREDGTMYRSVFSSDGPYRYVVLGTHGLMTWVRMEDGRFDDRGGSIKGAHELVKL